MSLILQHRDKEDIVLTIPPSTVERTVVLFKARNGQRKRLGIIAPREIVVSRVPAHKQSSAELDTPQPAEAACDFGEGIE